MAVEGWVDIFGPTAIGGWAADAEKAEFLLLELIQNGQVIGSTTANAFRNELLGRPDAVARKSFWFLPEKPIVAPETVRVRVAGSDYFLPNKPEPIPLPTDQLMFDVVGASYVPGFLAAGAENYHILQQLVAETKGSLRDGGRVLDWGCGCGRVARHWVSQADRIEFYGCDIHEDAIAWCSENLPMGRYAATGLLPPLPYPDNHFDLLYGTSVLTHLLFHTHYRWMAEIWRVLKPGGLAILTTQGPSIFPIVARSIATGGTRARAFALDNGMFVEVELVEGSNSTGNVVTRDVMEVMFWPFQIKTFHPCFGLMGIQDTYVFYKGSASKLRLRPTLLERRLSTTEIAFEVPIPDEAFTECSILAAAPGLVDSATIELSIVFEGSALLPITSGRVALQEKSGWTKLEAAYKRVKVGPLPAHDGKVKLIATCQSASPMDGATLALHNAVFA